MPSWGSAFPDGEDMDYKNDREAKILVSVNNCKEMEGRNG